MNARARGEGWPLPQLGNISSILLTSTSRLFLVDVLITEKYFNLKIDYFKYEGIKGGHF